MSGLVKRPSVTLGPGSGLFRNDHFQLAYATNDIERACQLFSERFGIKAYKRLEGPLKAGGHIRIELAWAGGVMYELVHAHGPGSDCFTSLLPKGAEELVIRPHHLGYFVHSAAEWEALEREIQERGLRVAHVTDVPGFLKAYIVDTLELGHYLEYIFPEPGGISFFESVPSS